jgi:ribA/ribD-fused uncharacterized protein
VRNLLEEFQMADVLALSTVDTKKPMLAFWSGPFSQWYGSKFNFYGMTFANAEQFMMLAKACLFKDREQALNIMNETDPRVIKKFGRAVKNFDQDRWEPFAVEMVTLASYLKFTQNGELAKELEDSKDRWMVEASPYDVIWGVGLRPEDPGVNDVANWKGLNYLGNSIMVARDIINDPTPQNMEFLMDIMTKAQNVMHIVKV